MKKINLLFIVICLFLQTGVFKIKAQGTWFADSTMQLVQAATELPLQIPSLKCMHSDPAGVVGKSDKGAPVVEYNGITYNNEAFIQGSTNGMYYAFRPEKDGKLDVSVKMSANKKTFILELTENCPDNSNLVNLTTNNSTGDAFTNNASYFTTPQVYDTRSQTFNTWNGTTVASTELTYMVFSWNVQANKTYVIGCFGSKMMLRGVNFTAGVSVKTDNIQSSFVYPNPAKNNITINISNPTNIAIYTVTGKLIKQQLVTPAKNTIDVSDLKTGVYFIKDMNNSSAIHKLVIK